MMLKYPNDRVNGYVLLSVNGEFYLPEWDLTRTNESRGSVEGDNLKYAGAFLQLAKRMHEND